MFTYPLEYDIKNHSKGEYDVISSRSFRECGEVGFGSRKRCGEFFTAIFFNGPEIDRQYFATEERARIAKAMFESGKFGIGDYSEIVLEYGTEGVVE